MIPFAQSSEDAVDIQSVCATTIPPHGKRAVAAVVEEELTPTWAYLMGVVDILVVAHPELYRGLAKHLGDGIRYDDAALVHVGNQIGSLLRNVEHHGIGGS